ncbi:MAG: ABC transporter substrate-binding protein [Clostridiales bacterium]|nr:ABC transporter substrate-binding protein [Clostridiales bacterium]
MKIKKSLLLMLSLMLIVSLTGCGEAPVETQQEPAVTQQEPAVTQQEQDEKQEKAPEIVETSLLGQAPGSVRKDFEHAVLKFFPEETGHRISQTWFRGCFDSADDFWEGANKGELNANVIMAYGRTGEAPEGTDIYGAWYVSRPLLKSMPNHITLRPEFEVLVDPEALWQVPFVDTMLIIYNPTLIDRKDVPTSWAGLADFDKQIAIPAWGCFAMRTLTYLYEIVGEDKFTQIMENGGVPALKLCRDDSRDELDNPLAAGCAVKAVLSTGTDEIRRGFAGKDIAVGIGSLQREELRLGLEDGTLGAIWPEEGAMAFPYLMAVRKNPNAADLALFDFLTKGETMQKIVFEGGWSSTLVDGPVHPIVEENKFNYYFVSLEELRNETTHRRIEEIVAEHGLHKKGCVCCP